MYNLPSHGLNRSYKPSICLGSVDLKTVLMVSGWTHIMVPMISPTNITKHVLLYLVCLMSQLSPLSSRVLNCIKAKIVMYNYILKCVTSYSLSVCSKPTNPVQMPIKPVPLWSTKLLQDIHNLSNPPDLRQTTICPVDDIQCGHQHYQRQKGIAWCPIPGQFQQNSHHL